MKKVKMLFLLSFVCLMFFVALPVDAYAAPAPDLKSIAITDVTADERNIVHIEVVEIGTSRNRNVYCDNTHLKENTSEVVMLDIDHDGFVDGYRRYFTTNYTVYDIHPGFTLDVRAEFTNANRPWNTLSARRRFVFDYDYTDLFGY